MKHYVSVGQSARKKNCSNEKHFCFISKRWPSQQLVAMAHVSHKQESKEMVEVVSQSARDEDSDETLCSCRSVSKPHQVSLEVGLIVTGLRLFGQHPGVIWPCDLLATQWAVAAASFTVRKNKERSKLAAATLQTPTRQGEIPTTCKKEEEPRLHQLTSKNEKQSRQLFSF